MSRLIVKNFGPLKDVDIELNRINLFIGENGSGKSVLAKVITIALDFSKSNDNDILKKFDEYNINYIQENTIIKLVSQNKEIFLLKNTTLFISEENKLETSIDYIQEMKKKYNVSYNEFDKFASSKLLKIFDFLTKNNTQQDIALYKDNINEALELLEKMDKNIKILEPQYIPAERNLVSLFNKSLSTLILEEVPLPKFLLRFSSEFEKAGNELKELEFLNVKYVNGDGLDRHKVYFNDKDYLPLEFSSSGIQSALPLYLTVKYFANKHRNIIIEEPEQNLFPKAQSETIKYIIEQVSYYNSLFMMTHSPYVLSTLNNLIMAYKVAQMSKDTKERVKEFIKEEQWINPNEFSAYYLENGIAKNIVSKRGLISDNEIDNISDEMGDEFDTLMEIYREFKYAK